MFDKIFEIVLLLKPYVEVGNAYVSLVLAVPVIWTWIIVIRRKRRERKINEEIQIRPGHRPVILITTLLKGEKDIRSNVERFRQQHEELRDIPKERIFVVNADEVMGTKSQMSAGDMHGYFDCLEKTIGRVFMEGPDVIHYFHAGPFPTAATMGALLNNGPRVMMYHWDVNKSSYENWGLLRPVRI